MRVQVPPSDTTHFPIFVAFRGECLRADRDVSPEFVLSGQVGDLEPELFVDGCLQRWLGVADDIAQVAQAGDEGQRYARFCRSISRLIWLSVIVLGR
jgi:hypothetical protein